MHFCFSHTLEYKACNILCDEVLATLVLKEVTMWNHLAVYLFTAKVSLQLLNIKITYGLQ